MAQYESSDEILMEIVRLNQTITTRRDRYFEIKESHAELEQLRDTLQQAYLEAQKAYQEVSGRYRDETSEMENLTKQQKEDNEKLDNLKRILSRLQDKERLNEEYDRRLEEFRNKCLNADWRAENRTDGKGAYPYQIDGAISAAVAKRALLGDKRGLGKTLTSIIYMDLLEVSKAIIICPGDTIDNFIREINLWSPHRSPIKIAGMSKAMRDNVLPVLRDASQFVILVNYEAWRKDKQLVQDLIALKATTVIWDEAHVIKERDSLASKGVRDIVLGLNECPKCEVEEPIVERIKLSWQAQCACGYRAHILEFCSVKNVLPMTGTPILNKPQELYPQLELIDPEGFPSEKKYKEDYCRQLGPNRWGWGYGGEKKVAARMGHRYIARTPETAGVIIPPQTVVEHVISKMTMQENYPKQWKAYLEARDIGQIMLDPDRGIAISIPAIITVLLRLRQVLAWPADIELKWTNPDNPEIEEKAHLDAKESAKVDIAEQLIRDIVEEGDRVIVFSQFKGPLHELHRRLDGLSALYDGSVSRNVRNEIELDFDPKTAPVNPRFKVGLFNYKTGGVGLNLHAATHELMLDREWNPGKDDQAKGRIQRLGQTRETTVHVIKCQDTVDSWMEDIIEGKRQTIDGFESSTDLYRKAYEALRKGEM